MLYAAWSIQISVSNFASDDRQASELISLSSRGIQAV